MREFVVFYRGLVADYCRQHAPELSADRFFSCLLQDNIFNLHEGDVIAAFKQASRGLIQSPPVDASASEGYLLAA